MPQQPGREFARSTQPTADDHALAALIAERLTLSPTQALVALGIWRGMSEKQIAGWIERSPATVHSHLRAIYQRLRAEGVTGQVQLALAVERVINFDH